MNYLTAEVEVPSDVPLEEMARKLSQVLGGVIFRSEETGRFEEVPAFVAENDCGITFILFGIPEGEICDVYILKFSAKTELPIAEFERNLRGIMPTGLAGKNVNARGYYDYSDELANALAAKGVNAASMQ